MDNFLRLLKLKVPFLSFSKTCGQQNFNVPYWGHIGEIANKKRISNHETRIDKDSGCKMSVHSGSGLLTPLLA